MKIPCFQLGPHMKREEGLGLIHQAAVHHPPGPQPPLFCGLKNHQGFPGQTLLVVPQHLGRAQANGHVHVMPAGMHHPGHPGCVVHPGLLSHRQGVRIRPDGSAQAWQDPLYLRHRDGVA